MDIYIKSSDCISAQSTFELSLPTGFIQKEETFYNAIIPEYKRFISPKLLRRMSPIIRNGVACSLSVLQKAELKKPDAIIVGTALGCLKDTTIFLTQLIEENEELPNPTHFIQSTHNTIAGQIALLLSCKAYNFTFSQNHNSFETALIDAQLLLLENKAKNVLVGAVDEMSENTYELIKELPCYKNTIPGEGASFFSLSTQEGVVQLKAVRIINNSAVNYATELHQLGLSINDIDLVIGGDNTENDPDYFFFKETFKNKAYLWYKPFVGEFGTASGIALWIATKVLEEQAIPECWCKNSVSLQIINNILIYNKVGKESSLMFVSLRQ